MKKLLLIISIFNCVVFAQRDGTLDPSFGTNGQVRTCITDHSIEVTRLIIQNDDKIVVGIGDFLKINFLLARYNKDGTLDNNFGNNGIVTTFISFGGAALVFALALQPDNKIVAAGVGHIGNFVLVRYNPNGSLDTSFGAAGIMNDVTNPGFINDLAIQTNGKIVAVGSTSEVFFSDGGRIVRYNSNGSLDTTFNGTGIVDVSGLVPGSTIGLRAVNIQNDSKIVVVGTISSDGSTNSLFIARYLPTGALDTSFNGTGFDTQLIERNTIGRDVVVLFNGKIIALTRSSDLINNHATLLQYNSNGKLDVAFGTNGIETFDIESVGENPSRLAIQSDSKILIVTGSSNNFIRIARRNLDGSVDTSFGPDATGLVVFQILNQISSGTDIAINSRGSIIASGIANHCIGLAQLEVNSLHYSKTSQALWQAYYNQNVKVADV